MTYNIISTGSKGNAVVLNDNILIDCGVSMKQLRPYIQSLRLVLLTHKHSDHFKARVVAALRKERPTLRWGCCEWMVPLLLESGVHPGTIDVYDVGGEYAYGTIAVKPVSLVHNVPNCGYHIFSGGEKILYATDTGSLDGVEANDYDLYMIEANHAEEELRQREAAKLARGEFSYEAAAAMNHLSREKALAWLSKNAGAKSRVVFLHQHEDRN